MALCSNRAEDLWDKPSFGGYSLVTAIALAKIVPGSSLGYFPRIYISRLVSVNNLRQLFENSTYLCFFHFSIIVPRVSSFFHINYQKDPCQQGNH